VCFLINVTFETIVKPLPSELHNLACPIITVIYLEILTMKLPVHTSANAAQVGGWIASSSYST
jgi:hypothetical protein